MKTFLVTTLLCFSFSTNAHCYSDTVNEQEIQILVKQGSFQEAIDILPEISPSKRSLEWRILAKKSFANLIEQNMASGNFHGNIEHGSVIKSRYPFLLKDTKIMSSIFKSGLFINPNCNTRFDNECMSMLGYALAFNNDGPKVAAGLVENNRNQMAGEPLELIQLYEMAAKTKLNEICSDEKLQNAVSLAASKNDKVYQNFAFSIVTKSCDKFMFKSLEDNLHRDDTIQKLMCKPMSVSKQLGKISLMVCKDKGLI
ncbi:hypothetical protein EGC82_12835 [Shewanella livingstonensis]|uniref:Sel1 repeat family protein n=1 Tax=Shewanella livingstonensis TaxID=150120 RepID=A0A3G8LVM9_9GAMM|nr:hypothetical protein [Shewanella livingstonensis]AZG73567.1 hypothetical protein EGC82_12835 [Shewanella livingstonensis]